MQKQNSNLRKYIMVTLSNVDRRGLSRESVVHRILTALKCTRVVVAEEKHKRSGIHYHVAIESSGISKHVLHRVVRDLFPEFEGSQCNVTCFKSWSAMCKYVLKEDKRPYCWNISVDEVVCYVSNSNRHIRLPDLANKLREKSSWDEVLRDHDLVNGYVSKYYSSARCLFADLRAQEEAPALLGRIYKYIQSTEGVAYSRESLFEKWEAIEWLIYNLCRSRHLRQLQLLILGLPGTHKTNLISALSEFLKVYMVPRRENDFSGADQDYDLWVIDEWEHHKMNTGLLKIILDGQRTVLDIKYARTIEKKKNVPIIMLGNAWKEFSSQVDKDAIKDRLQVVHFRTKLDFVLEGPSLSRTIYGPLREAFIKEKGEAYVLLQEGVSGSLPSSSSLPSSIGPLSIGPLKESVWYVSPDGTVVCKGDGASPVKRISFLDQLRAMRRRVLLPIQKARRGRPKKKVYV